MERESEKKRAKEKEKEKNRFSSVDEENRMKNSLHSFSARKRQNILPKEKKISCTLFLRTDLEIWTENNKCTK